MPRAMNDPHVVALVFSVEHGPAVAYRGDAPAIEHQEPGFRVRLTDGTVRFELDEHYATQEEALERVGPYVRNWEMDACLSGRPGDFRLEFIEAEVIDRDPPPPTPGTINLSATITAGVPTIRANLSVVRPSYPPPPAGVTLKADDRDVETMYRRLSDYYEGREPLPGVAYFCFTMLKSLSSKHGRGGQRARAAAYHHISDAALKEIEKLSSTKGGAGSARKAGGVGTDLSRKEELFLEAAVKMIIRRAAEVAQNPGAAFPPITLADLPGRS